MQNPNEGRADFNAATPQEEKLVGFKEVAETLGLAVVTVELMTRRGKLPHFKFGRSVRFRLSDVKAAIDSRCQVLADSRRRVR